jgi:hypothetical protein
MLAVLVVRAALAEVALDLAEPRLTTPRAQMAARLAPLLTPLATTIQISAAALVVRGPGAAAEQRTLAVMLFLVALAVVRAGIKLAVPSILTAALVVARI